MLFRFALLSVIVANATANPIFGKGVNDIPATSNLGSKLLSTSRLLNDNNNDDEEFSWVAGYSLRFERCLQSFQYGYNNGGDNNNDGGDGNNPVSVNRLVEYHLCPSGSCSSACENGAAYVVGLDEFIQIYVEARRESQEEACEAVRENCYCNGDDEDACEQQCFEDAGLDFCVVNEDEDGGEDDVDMYTTCVASERQANENNNGNNYRYYRFSSYTCYNEDCALYVGPYCSNDGLSIYLGAFIDETCSFGAPPGTYESYNYGKSLPYSYEPLIGSECISCNITRDDEDNDGEEEVEINEMCAELYQGAIKCEENLTAVDYPDTAACYYIKEVLPAMTNIYAKERASYSASVYYSVFGFGAVAFAALSHRYYSKLHGGARVNLSDQGIATGVAA